MFAPVWRRSLGVRPARQSPSRGSTRCRGLEALRSYRVEWDERARAFKKTPAHKWASHGADAWRYLSLSWRAPMREPEPEKPPAGIPLPELTWDQFFDIEDGPLSREERV
jgi:hypothetical protein